MPAEMQIRGDSMKGKFENSMRLFFTAIISVLVMFSFSCGGDVVGTSQNYSENQPPAITVFKSDQAQSDDLIPHITMTLTVNATDPENENLKYTFHSDDGSFSSQTSSDGGQTVGFTIGNNIVSGQSITVDVTVSDGHENSVKETLLVGKAKTGPMVAFVGDTPAMIRADKQSSFTFRASQTGFYQIQILDPGVEDSSITWNDSLPRRLCFLGDEVTFTLDGSQISGSTADVQMAGNSNKIAVAFKNDMGDQAMNRLTLREDTRSPDVSIISPGDFVSGETYTSETSFSVMLEASDFADDGGTGCGKVQLCYTTDGNDPNFNNGTVVAMTKSGSKYYSTINIDGSAIGSYNLRYAVRDGLENSDSVSERYNIVTETVPPANVSGLSSSVTDRSIKLTWTDDPPDDDFDVVKIIVRDAGGEQLGSTITVVEGVKTYTLNGLVDNTYRKFEVWTIDENSNRSSIETVEATTLDPDPNSPVITLTQISNHSFTFTASQAPEDDDIDKLEFSVVQGGTPNYSEYTGSETQNGTVGEVYEVHVKATDKTGNYTERVISVKIPDFPEGTEYTTGNIHLISNVAELMDISSHTDWFSHFFILVNDIDMDGIEGYTPIGSWMGIHFTGFFEGGGNTIKNLDVSNSNYCCGLFGYVESAVIQNIILKDSGFNVRNYVGAIAGYVKNSEINNCKVNITDSYSHLFKAVDGGSGRCGGIAGEVLNSTIYGCVVNVTSGTLKISSNYPNVGGIVGKGSGTMIESCEVSGEVEIYCGYDDTRSNTRGIGGIAGYLGDSSEIKDCAFSGSKIQGKSYVGGIAGRVSGPGKGTTSIYNSTVTLETGGAEISGNSGSVGGIVGCSTDTKLEGCNIYITAANASIKSNSPYVGGISGNTLDSVIEGCLLRVVSEGSLEISASHTCGGIAGRAFNTTLSSNDIDVSSGGTLKVTGSYGTLGGIAGSSTDSSFVQNCNVSVLGDLDIDILTSGITEIGNIGGIAGSCESGASINICTVEAIDSGSISISSKSEATDGKSENVGGIVGKIEGNSNCSVTYCTLQCSGTGNSIIEVSAENVNGYAYNVGGIAGFADSSIASLSQNKVISENYTDSITIKAVGGAGCGDSVGGICGKSNIAALSYCHVVGDGTVDIHCNGSNAGGIVGSAEFPSNSNDVLFWCSIYGGSNKKVNADGSNIGGIAGTMTGGSISRCWSYGNIGVGSGVSNIGGIAGSINDVKINNCFSRSNVGNGNASKVGGICGWAEESVTNSSISYSYTVGAIKGQNNVGTICANDPDMEYGAYYGDSSVGGIYDVGVGAPSYSGVSFGSSDLGTLDTELRNTILHGGVSVTVYWKILDVKNNGLPYLEGTDSSFP